MDNWSNMAIVCIYKELGEVYKKILKEYKINIDIVYVDYDFGMNLESMLEVAKKLKEQGKEILIARGFFAKKIREKIDVKVIEIKICGLDVIKVLAKYANKNLKIGVIECDAFITVIKDIADIMEVDTKYYEVKQIEDYNLNLKKAVDDGMDVIIGGAMDKFNKKTIMENNIIYDRIESSELAVRNSLENAFEIYKLNALDKRRKDFIENIINSYNDGIIAFDEYKNIIELNYLAEDILNLKRSDLIGKNIKDISLYNNLENFLDNKFESSQIFEVKQQKYLLDIVPIKSNNVRIGTLLIIKEVEMLQKQEIKLRNELNKKGLVAKYTIDNIIGETKNMLDLKELAKKYARTNGTILILGESGTGKEVFAQAIHNYSKRATNPFVAINCSAFQSNLLDSELFGYVGGAFTGAKKEGKAGLFELAHTGTIFLDEIGDMDLSMQSRLLRVIQEREVMRIGDNKVISIDVRIIAATNKNLYEEVEKGNFRRDLYYRLNILNMTIPPLRERKDDIKYLIENSLKSINKRLNCKVTGIDEKTIQKMKEYNWYGNIRELNGMIEKMICIVQFGKINYDDISFIFDENDFRSSLTKQANKKDDFYDMTLKQVENILIENALKKYNYNKPKAAEHLGIDRTTLSRKLNKIKSI